LAIKAGGILILIVLLLYSQLNEYPNLLFVFLLYAIVLILFHIHRKDKTIIASIYEKPFLIFWGEYIFLSIPLMLVIIFTNYFYLFPLPVFISFPIAFMVGRQGKIQMTKHSFQKYFNNSFEWAAGMRKNYLFIVFLILLAFIFILKPYISFLFYGLILIICCEFYTRHEPLQLLFIAEKPAFSFMLAKIREACINFYRISLPFCLLYAAVNYETAWMSLYFILLTIIIFSYSIALKYASYVPNGMNMSGQLFQVLGVGSVFIPFLLPLTLLMTIYFFIKAEKNLKKYLYAYN
jgi:hypothetical protein